MFSYGGWTEVPESRALKRGCLCALLGCLPGASGWGMVGNGRDLPWSDSAEPCLHHGTRQSRGRCLAGGGPFQQAMGSCLLPHQNLGPAGGCSWCGSRRPHLVHWRLPLRPCPRHAHMGCHKAMPPPLPLTVNQTIGAWRSAGAFHTRFQLRAFTFSPPLLPPPLMEA